MQSVASYLRIKAPSATSLITHLVGQGLVRRVTGNDKRSTRLYLTPRGKKLLLVHDKRSNTALRKVFSEFKPSDVHELVRILRHVRDIHDKDMQH